jgi:hypothetical protein
MQKSFRFFVLATALSFTVVPGVLAEQMGCNPHPQAASARTTSTLQIVAYTVASLLGF